MFTESMKGKFFLALLLVLFVLVFVFAVSSIQGFAVRTDTLTRSSTCDDSLKLVTGKISNAEDINNRDINTFQRCLERDKSMKQKLESETKNLFLESGSSSCEEADASDVNNDGIVDIDDVADLVLVWGTSDENGDVNNDGIVDIDDLILVVLYFGHVVGSCEEDPMSITVDYPVRYVVVQRDTNQLGDILIEGTYNGSIDSIEASFNGGAWQTIDSQLSLGTFSGFLENQSVGQGLLSVRATNNNSVSVDVMDVGIGDVFVISGQSNAVGPGNNFNSLDPGNNFTATVYRTNDIWDIANDPLHFGDGKGSWWVGLADSIIQEQGIPVAYITTAVSGSPVRTWVPGRVGYDDMISQISEATRGTMSVRANLFFQGESDVIDPVSNYNTYTSWLNEMADAFVSETNSGSFETKVLVGQIGDVTGFIPNFPIVTREKVDEIRKAQLDAWDADNNISAGPSSHDIGPHVDGVHFQLDEEIEAMEGRWWASVRKEIYGTGDGRGPSLVSAESNGNNVTLEFSESSGPLDIQDYQGQSSSKAEGFFIVGDDYNLTDDNVVSTLISGNDLELVLDTSLPVNPRIFIGSFNDSLGKPVLVDGSEFALPVETAFGVSII